MTLILTFLGKGDSHQSLVSIATAQKLSNLGLRVLLVGQNPGPTLSTLLETPVNTFPTEVSPNLMAVKLSSTFLLEKGWEKVKELESQYLRSPTLQNIYGQELGILPGIDRALFLNALWEYYQSCKYDVIVYDGDSPLSTIRMFGIPEILSWYLRRFGQVLKESDVGKTLSPFIQPIISAILNVSWTPNDPATEPTNHANDILGKWKNALADPKHVATYLVTTDDELAIAQTKYYWGCAQQVGLIVKGVLVHKGKLIDSLSQEFSPLSVTVISQPTGTDWQSLQDALPDFLADSMPPQPITVDAVSREVRVFLPGFDKNQIKLTQYGPEITIEAGDQRRNIELPVPLRRQPVRGAKFQNHYLIISF
ncbi:Get3/ArsA fold putative tail anchor-mediating ATPase NosAFP [cyanobacterium endosymbiont of Epithemia turgida]|uniref:Get3/ArsA fold putative tail anchor-mediating ATPase NosAFP n=1 Tax=cyanobacterium endosymbiont of Epithemia turgida TaxID=718217 RepID=UPI0004D1105E|nr:ArsA family ATPase [cyanobacterium endosymbiont of Epithemia turgida]BAP18106.1 putative anion-transporting ATPase [cyanobacterium endosymbiont of Epithemia turgida isolate EtSB Lake Yunoko]